MAHEAGRVGGTVTFCRGYTLGQSAWQRVYEQTPCGYGYAKIRQQR